MDLSRGVKTFVDDEIDDQPGEDESAEQLPLDPARVLDALSDTQHSLAARQGCN